jgi:hypothetical protein
VTDQVAVGILAERPREYSASLDRFDKALTDVERLIALTDQALDQGHTDTAGWLLEQLEQAGQVADELKVGADVALAAVADARLVVERGHQHDR